jgi:hypothetical protein
VTHEPPRSEHLDLEHLADLDEDMLAPAETAAAEEHLADCGQCRQRRADLRGTRALLSTLPAESMPSAVAGRIDAALAALAPTTIVPLTPKRRSWRAHPTMAGLGAAATVAALVAAIVVARTSSHHSNSDNGSTEAAGAAARQAPLALPQATTSGNDYTAVNLARTLPDLLRPRGPAVGGAAPTSPAPGAVNGATTKSDSVPPALTRLYSSPTALQDCVRKVEQGGPLVEPLAIDFASYQGEPTLLIVLPPLSSAPAGTVGAWFVGPRCDGTFDDLQTYLTVPTASGSPSPGG